MSLVNEALKKAERLRSGQPPANFTPSDTEPTASAEPRKPGRSQFVILLTVNAAVLVVFLIAMLVYVRPRSTTPAQAPVTTAATPMPAPPVHATSAPDNSAPVVVRVPATAAVPASPPASAPVSPPVESAAAVYFLPPTTPGGGAKTRTVDYDLLGMTVVGKDTLLSITRRSDKRTFWITVGKTVGEVTAVSYDQDTDQAVIRVNGRLYSIGLRNSSAISAPEPARPN